MIICRIIIDLPIESIDLIVLQPQLSIGYHLGLLRIFTRDPPLLTYYRMNHFANNIIFLCTFTGLVAIDTYLSITSLCVCSDCYISIRFTLTQSPNSLEQENSSLVLSTTFGIQECTPLLRNTEVIGSILRSSLVVLVLWRTLYTCYNKLRMSPSIRTLYSQS